MGNGNKSKSKSGVENAVDQVAIVFVLVDGDGGRGRDAHINCTDGVRLVRGADQGWSARCGEWLVQVSYRPRGAGGGPEPQRQLQIPGYDILYQGNG